MPATARSTAWQPARRWFRRSRICLWFVLLALLAGLVYLNQVGLPEFLKTRLQAELRAHGADFQFRRLRWRWYRGFVAEQATLASTLQGTGPRLSLDEVALDWNWGLLLRQRRWEVRSLEILRGGLILPLNETNQPAEHLELREVSARLRFLPGDVWELEELSARFLDSTIHIVGTVTNASALRGWGQRPAATAVSSSLPFWRAQLRESLRVCRQMQFRAPPEFHVRFRGDARDPASFVAGLRCRASGVQTPWLRLDDVQLDAELNQPPMTEGTVRSQFRFLVKQAQTSWGEFRQGQLSAVLEQPRTNVVPAQVHWEASAAVARAHRLTLRSARLHASSRRLSEHPQTWRTELTLSADEVKSDWGAWRSNRLSGWLTHSLTNLLPQEAAAQCELHHLDSPWGGAEEVTLVGRLTPAPAGQPLPSAAWAWWTNLAPYRLDLSLSAHPWRAARLHLEQVAVEGSWQAPEVRVTNLLVRLAGGSLQATDAVLNVRTREAGAILRSDFDVHAVAPWFGESTARWLDQFAWAEPPVAQATVRAEVPLGTNTPPDWKQAVLPTLSLSGWVRGHDASYRGVPVSSATLRVALSNQVLRLTDFVVLRPEGQAELEYELQTRTQEFRWRVHGSLDVKAVGPIINQDAPRFLDLFEFTGPTTVAGQVWGCWAPPKRIECALDIAATNFTFRGEPVDQLHGLLRLTNRFLTVTDLKLRTGEEWIEAPAVGLASAPLEVFLTNVQCRIDPRRVARAIGTNAVATLQPYRFDTPPHGRVQGRIAPRRGAPDVDLVFELAGGPFHYWRLNAPEIAGVVHWLSNCVAITNVTADFHQGRLAGELWVNLSPQGDTSLRFRAHAANANLHSLVADLLETTNRLEGTITTTLNITRAQAADNQTWTGNGQAEMRDGLLWDLPIFGAFSPILNAMLPGLGNSRARSAKASFTLERGLIKTDDLAVQAGPVRLQYKGTVAWTGSVEARVEAEILASTPLLGPFLSLALTPLSKVLVYRVGGTLSNPQLEPLYVPRLLLPVLHPFHTLKSLFPSEPPAPPKAEE